MYDKNNETDMDNFETRIIKHTPDTVLSLQTNGRMVFVLGPDYGFGQ